MKNDEDGKWERGTVGLEQAIGELFEKISGGIDSGVEDYKEYVANFSENNPSTVGMVDGFTNIWLNTPTDRMDTPEYTEHVKYGRIVGLGSIIPLAVLAGKARLGVMSAPILARAMDIAKETGFGAYNAKRPGQEDTAQPQYETDKKSE